MKNINDEIRKVEKEEFENIWEAHRSYKDVKEINEMLKAVKLQTLKEVKKLIENAQTWGISKKGFKAIKDEFAIFINRNEILGEE